jgi:peptidoglycan/xylan/chitin deacetylase (PgdA/CDA1 family)
VSDRGRIALTFDAEHPDRRWCPPDNAARILDALGSAGARATFFVQGRWAEAYPDLAGRIADEGHLVGSHSHFHAEMPLLSDAGLADDLAAARAAIEATTGRDPRPWFRCPWGAGSDDPRVLGAIDAGGYRHVGWHVVVEDWEPDRTGARIAADVLRGIDTRGDGTVVLLHTWPGGTAEALPMILDGLRERGLGTVTVDDLPELP